jgi:hypothetical protein
MFCSQSHNYIFFLSKTSSLSLLIGLFFLCWSAFFFFMSLCFWFVACVFVSVTSIWSVAGCFVGVGRSTCQDSTANGRTQFE